MATIHIPWIVLMAPVETGKPSIEALVKQYGATIYSRCLFLLKDPNQAEDAVQDVYLKLMRSLSTYREEAQLYTWIYRLTTNHCIDLLRKRNRWEVRFVSNDTIQGRVETSVDASILASEALKGVPQDDIALLYYYYVDEMTLEEIGNVIGQSRKTVSRKIQKIVRRVKHAAKEPPR